MQKSLCFLIKCAHLWHACCCCHCRCVRSLLSDRTTKSSITVFPITISVCVYWICKPFPGCDSVIAIVILLSKRQLVGEFSNYNNANMIV